jgi:hypothetical protein
MGSAPGWSAASLARPITFASFCGSAKAMLDGSDRVGLASEAALHETVDGRTLL